MTQFYRTPSHKHHWFKRLIALLALLNLILVFFDLSYLTWRDFYGQTIPNLVQIYDPIKGIEPHQETQYYLERVNQLTEQVTQTGLQSPETENLLEQLQRLSERMVVDNPFKDAKKSQVLAKIEQEIRDRTQIPLAQEAFATFWSPTYLSQAGWQQERAFFDLTLRPLIAANYYRDVDKYGHFVDRFWLIDLPFVLIFAVDFFVRTFRISRRRPDLNWVEAMLRRWYDLFFLLPFLRWFRVLPISLRLHQTGLLNLEPLREQLNYDLAIASAQKLTEVIGVQTVNQLQQSIENGQITRWLLHPESRRPYIQVNNINEVKAITTRLAQISFYDVLPEIQSDIEDLIQHTLVSILNQSPIYRQFQTLPGLKQFPSQFTEKLAKELSHSAYNHLTNLAEDPLRAEIINRLSKNFQEALEAELEKKHNRQEIQSLLVAFLEEIKINYVKNIAKNEQEKFVEEAEQLHRLAKK